MNTLVNVLGIIDIFMIVVFVVSLGVLIYITNRKYNKSRKEKK
jgi:hypothetical protein